MGRYRKVGWLRRPGKADRAAALDALDQIIRVAEQAPHALARLVDDECVPLALDQVGLADRGNDTFGVLSGGQRQRVLIARAIAQEARLLLLDEPFNGVDSATQDVLIEVLGRLRANGTAVVMATHDISVAHLACGHACLLNRRQVAFGPLDEALTADALKSTYGQHSVVLAEGTALVTTHQH